VRRRCVVVATVAAGLALLSACGARPGPPSQPLAAPRQAVVPQQQAAQQPAKPPVTVSVTGLPGLGEVLTDQDGRTLYLFTQDSRDPAVSTCVAECATQWPPLTTATNEVDVSGADESLVGTLSRPDGATQVTYNGWPLYYFAKDAAPGQADGQGVNEVWFTVSKAGRKAGAVAVVAEDIPGFGQALTDQEGRTLYLFTQDGKDPSKSTCDGECAVNWPPLVAGGDVELSGVDPALVGRVARADGSQQVTVGGWPVYTFVKDTAPGLTTGHGVDDVWFVIEAAGCKSSAPVRAPQDAAEPESTGY
jgi:predicted lipoprotein with Yx(FWY)xxD motif